MKRDNRGFLLAESLIVSTFVLTVLIFLFVQFRNLITNYKISYNYNNVESIYDLGSISEYFRNNQVKPFGNYIMDSPYIVVYNNNGCSTEVGLVETTFCENIMSESGVSFMIYTSSNVETIQNYIKTNDDSKLPQDFRDFILKISANNIQNKGRLFAKFKNGTFATIAVDTKYDDSIETKEYQYTGDVQSYVVRNTGYYKIELWGAQGGSLDNAGGKGAYTKGEIYLTEGEKIYLYVGATGSKTTTFNVGGSGGYYGGGATDVRLTNGKWDDVVSLRSRIMVAAGGGGVTSSTSGAQGGNAGTLVGNDGKAHSIVGDTYIGKKAFQTKGGDVNTNGGTIGSFGKGGEGVAYTDGHVGGGGGAGYYGGSGAKWHAGGGGGSSYISGYAGVNSITSASSGVHTNQTLHYSGKYFVNTEMVSATNTGNGKAKISYMGDVSFNDSQKIKNVRYIKDCINGTTMDSTNQWVEIQAISKGVNVAKDKSVTSTGTAKGSTYKLSYVTDGIMDTNSGSFFFQTSETGNQCVTVDLGKEYDLEEIGVWHYFWDRSVKENLTTVAGEDKVFKQLYYQASPSESSTGNHINKETDTHTLTDYYVSSSGSDVTGNGTISSPYQTIKKAYDMASTYPTTINLMTDITLSEKLSLNSKNITLTSYNGTWSIIRNSSYTGLSMIDLEGVNLTLKNITIDGNNVKNSGSLIYAGSKLNIESGTTIKNGYSTSSSRAGGITVASQVNINSGTIDNNTNSSKSVYNNILIEGNGKFYDKNSGYTSTASALKVATAINNNYALDVSGGKVGNGINVIMYQTGQKWKVIPNKITSGKVTYNYQSQLDGTQYLWVDGNTSTSGRNVSTWTFHGSTGGYWYMDSAGSGYYYIKNINGGMCLDVTGGTVTNGTNVEVYTCNQTNAQKWKFV